MQVVGVDGVRKAAEEFIQDNQLASDPPSVSSAGLEILDLHRRGRAGHPIRFVVGDFFKMRPDVAGTFEVAPSPPAGCAAGCSPSLRGQVDTQTHTQRAANFCDITR